MEDPREELKADDGVDDDDEDDEEGDVEEGDHGHEDGVEDDLKDERMANSVKQNSNIQEHMRMMDSISI